MGKAHPRCTILPTGEIAVWCSVSLPGFPFSMNSVSASGLLP